MNISTIALFAVTLFFFESKNLMSLTNKIFMKFFFNKIDLNTKPYKIILTLSQKIFLDKIFLPW